MRGKAVGGGLLMSLAVIPALTAAVLLGQDPSPRLAPAGYLAAAATYLLFFPVAAWLSILFPKAANLSKMGSEGKPHGGAVLAGFVTLILLFTLPAPTGFAGLYLAGPSGAWRPRELSSYSRPYSSSSSPTPRRGSSSCVGKGSISRCGRVSPRRRLRTGEALILHRPSRDRWLSS